MKTTEYNPTSDLFQWLARTYDWQVRTAEADQDAEQIDYEYNNYKD